jgi:hypothetical protein
MITDLNYLAMKGFLLLPVSILGVITSIHAQSYRSNLTFQKNIYVVAAIQIPFDEDVVTAAVKDYMSGKGYKDAHYKDFLVFRSVPVDKNPAVFSDAYFNINRKSRSEKDITIVDLLPVKKGETLSPATAEDSSLVSSSLIYLDSLNHYILHYSVQQQILIQQKTLDKTNAKMISLKNDSGDIAKKIRGYQSTLVQNKTDQDNQTKVISNTSAGDQAALAKAHNKMDKLMDGQADYEKKLRNSKADLENNSKDRETQQTLYIKETQSLDALKQRLQTLK